MSHGGGHVGHSHDHGDLEQPLLHPGDGVGHEAHGHESHGHDAHGDEAHGHECHGHGHGNEVEKGDSGGSGHGHASGHDHGDDHGGGHGHDHGHEHGHGGSACAHGHGHVDDSIAFDKKKMKIAIGFALFFMFVELIGGLIAGSLAIMTDAAHMLSDVSGFVVSILALHLSEQEATLEYSYGFQQAEIIGALFSIMIVWALTAVLVYEAVNRCVHLQEIHGEVMFIIAVLGVVVNIVLAKVLGHSHGHGGDDHGHSHGSEEGAAVQAAIAHAIGDIVQSVGVAVAALCIWLKPFDIGVTADGISRWNYADPACTFLFSVLVLYTTKAPVTRTISTLMAKSPKSIDQTDLAEKLQRIPNVTEVHDIHLWTMGSKAVLCTAHVMVTKPEHCTTTLKRCISLAQEAGINHPTFQIEIEGEFDPEFETYGGLHGPPQRLSSPHLERL